MVRTSQYSDSKHFLARSETFSPPRSRKIGRDNTIIRVIITKMEESSGSGLGNANFTSDPVGGLAIVISSLASASASVLKQIQLAKRGTRMTQID